MRRILTFLFIFAMLSANAQNWNISTLPQRFTRGLGIPVQDSNSFKGSADTSLIMLQKNDTNNLYFRYKGLYKKIGNTDSSVFATKYYVGNNFAYNNGSNATGTWPINISGNASTVSNGLY